MSNKIVNIFFTILILVLFSGISIISSTAERVQNVNSSPLFVDGNTLYVGGGGPNNYTKIQDAIDNASNGDTVFVFVRTYPYFENLIIDKSIDLIGQDKNCTLIDGSKNDNVISIYSDEVTVEGFTIQNAKDDIFHAGVKISNADSILLDNNIIQNNDGFGVFIQNSLSAELLIYGNIITNNLLGVYIEESSDLNFSNNHILDNKDGIYVLHSSNIRFFENTIQSYGLGFHISSSSDIIILKNLITDNSNGIYNYDSANIIISENTVDKNRWYGVWFRDSSDNIVMKNTISNNVDIGIFFDNSTFNTIKENTIIENDDGVYLERSSNNIIQNNNFRNYKLNAYFVASSLPQCLNRWKQNFWDRARILPKIIFGRIKLENTSFSWVNFDLNPAKEPYENDIIEIIKSAKSILYVGGLGPGNYSHIQDAIDDSSDNDTIYVFNGTYFEEIVINKPIHLIGEDNKNTFLLGNGTRDVILIISHYVEVREFSIQNGHFGIYIKNSSDILITDNDIVNNLQGISIQNECSQVTILKNFFDFNQYGIRIYSSSHVTVNFNIFQSYKLNAFFVGTSLLHCKHSWNENFWDKSNSLPYLIFGKIRIGDYSLLWLNIDWKPLSGPYV